MNPNRHSHRLAALFVLLAYSSCEQPPVSPDPAYLALQQRAVALTVDVAAGTVRQVELSAARGSATGVRFALVGSNEVTAVIGNVTRTPSALRRVRVRFDLALTNRLLRSDLVAASFPAPPAGQVVAFPFSTDPAGLFGLKVVPSDDWDGAPWNFFNDGACVPLTPPSDCYRWEGFGPTIPAGATTTAHTVGFDVDASVTSFTVYVVVAADIRDRATGPAIGVSDVAAVFTALVGGEAPPSRVIQVSNTGGGTLSDLAVAVNYQSGQPTGWLSAALDSPTAPTNVTLGVATATLAAGFYQATVTLNSPDASQPVSIAVVLLVGQASFVLSSRSVDVTLGYHGTSQTQTIDVTSTSGVPVPDLAVSIEYGSDASGWLSATLNSTTTPAQLTLIETPGDLLLPRYTAAVRVGSPLAPPQTIIVTIGITNPFPDLTFTGSRPIATGGNGVVNSTGFAVVNQGGGSAGQFNVGVCLSTTSSQSGCVLGLEAFVHVIGLAPSATYVVPPLQVPAPPGTYHVIAVVDPAYTATVTESDETNNALDLGQVTVTGP